MLSELLPIDVFGVFLVFVRLGAALMIMPGIGEAYIPVQIRLGAAAVLTFAISPIVLPTVPSLPELPIELFFLLLGELVIEYKNEIPSNVYGEYAQSVFFKEKEQFSEETIKALNLALTEAPKDPLVLTLEGVKYFRIGNLELARSSWEEAKGYLKTEEEKAVLQIGIDRLKNQ